jgi:nanoRNase/pAp phosphatase (c-di-AMP/oligoRNAs hydrolase)
MPRQSSTRPQAPEGVSRNTKASAFCSFVQRYNDLVLQTHDYPDPDAIAAAYGLAALISALGGQAVICYTGSITRAITQEMLSILRIPILPAVCRPGKDSAILVVDGRIQNTNVTKFPAKYVAEIDHHPTKNAQIRVAFRDVRPHYGSASSIVGEYWRDLGLPIPRSVATALAIGLNTDTQRLMRETHIADIEIYSWLFKKVDRTYLQYVLNNNIERADFQYYSRAITSLIVRENFGLADLEELDNPALIAIIGDFLLTAKEIGVMLTLALSENKVMLSLRSEDPEYPVNDISMFITQGIGSAGGHRSMAAGTCPIPEGTDPVSLKKQIIDRYFSCLKTGYGLS